MGPGGLLRAFQYLLARLQTPDPVASEQSTRARRCAQRQAGETFVEVEGQRLMRGPQTHSDVPESRSDASCRRRWIRCRKRSDWPSSYATSKGYRRRRSRRCCVPLNPRCVPK